MAGLVSTEQPLNILLHLDFIHLLVAQKTIQKCELRILIFIQKYVGCECLAYISHIYIYTFNKFSFTRLNFSSNLQLPRKKSPRFVWYICLGGLKAQQNIFAMLLGKLAKTCLKNGVPWNPCSIRFGFLMKFNFCFFWSSWWSPGPS